MFTVLFSNTSYNRPSVRLFLYPPHGEGSRVEGSRVEGSRNEPGRRPEYAFINDLSAAIDDAIWSTERLLENSEEADANALIADWTDSLRRVKEVVVNFLTGLRNLELPNDPKTRAETEKLLEKARYLSQILQNNLPKNSLIKELQGKLGEVKKLLSSNQ